MTDDDISVTVYAFFRNDPSRVVQWRRRVYDLLCLRPIPRLECDVPMGPDFTFSQSSGFLCVKVLYKGTEVMNQQLTFDSKALQPMSRTVRMRSNPAKTVMAVYVLREDEWAVLRRVTITLDTGNQGKSILIDAELAQVAHQLEEARSAVRILEARYTELSLVRDTL